MSLAFFRQIMNVIPLAIVVIGLLSYSFMSAQWTGAPANPPNSNVAPPINDSAAPQFKSGNLGS